MPLSNPQKTDYADPPQGRLGFTFVELSIALALSLLLILLMLVTFRAALQSMKRLDQISRENRMLRVGYFQVTKDADFWNSHADPSFPYMQHAMSARLADAGGAAISFESGQIAAQVQKEAIATGTRNGGFTDANSLYDVRPFRAVKWPMVSTLGGTGNAHVTSYQLPHDPSSWYRNHVQNNLPTGARVIAPLGLCNVCNHRVPRNKETGAMGWYGAGSCCIRLSWNTINESYVFDQATNTYKQCTSTSFRAMEFTDYDVWEECWAWDQQKHFGADFAADGWHDYYGNHDALVDLWVRVGRKAGWQPWHIVGDYAVLSNCEGQRAEEYKNPDLDKTADIRSQATWEMFQQLGVFGLYGYAPVCELNLLQVSSDQESTSTWNLPPDDRKQKNFRRGEIPWMLGLGTGIMRSQAMDKSDDANNPTAASATFATVRANWYNRENYFAAMPTYTNASNETSMMGGASALATDLGRLNTRCPFVNASTRLYLYGNDIYGNAFGTRLFGQQFYRHSQPMGLVYPVAPSRRFGTSAWDHTELNWSTLRPLSPLSFQTDDIARQLAQPMGIEILGYSSSFQIREGPYLTQMVDALVDSTTRLIASDQWQVMRNKHEHPVWHLPRHYQDDPMAPAMKAGAGSDMGVSSSIRRYRFNGLDHAWCKIQVIDAEGKSLSTLNFKTLSSNFRGARDYWGRKSANGLQDGFGTTGLKIGDFYE